MPLRISKPPGGSNLALPPLSNLENAPRRTGHGKEFHKESALRTEIADQAQPESVRVKVGILGPQPIERRPSKP